MIRWTYQASVTNIVDGDTVDLLIDKGFRSYFEDRFRMEGIQAPEKRLEGGLASLQALALKIPVESVVTVRTSHAKKRDPRDSFGRWLARIYVGDRDINQEMIDEGFAIPYVR